MTTVKTFSFHSFKQKDNEKNEKLKTGSGPQC